MREKISQFKAISTIVKKGGFVLFIIIAIIGIFIRYTSNIAPTTQKTQEEQMVEYQQKVGKDLFAYKPKTDKDKALYEGTLMVYCKGIGILCDKNTSTYSSSNFDKSVMGKMANAVMLPYYAPPASGTYYVLNSLKEAHLIPQSYAAEGLGFAGIVPFINIWKKLRDITFLIIALAMVISGFLIMFRSQMDAQHSIKLESALPKIILTMILINFSFAIAGFMIDFMYILSGLVIVTLGPLMDPSLSIPNVLNTYLHPSLFDLFNLGFGNYDGSILGFVHQLHEIFVTVPNAMLGLFGAAARKMMLFMIGLVLFPLYAAGIMRLGLTIGDKVIDSIPSADVIVFLITLIIVLPLSLWLTVKTPVLIIGFIILWSFVVLMAKLVIIVFKTYIKLLFYIILSPLILVSEALPGTSAFVPWLQTICVELLTFPAILAIFFMAGAFRYAITQGSLFRLPYFVSINPEGLSALIGYGTLLMMPNLIMTMKEKLNTKTIKTPEAGLGLFFEPATLLSSTIGKRAAGMHPTTMGEALTPGIIRAGMKFFGKKKP